MPAGNESPPKKLLCFVIGPIGDDNSLERKHADLLLHGVIKQVLEAEEFRYTVKRADEDADPGMIGDRVISDIIHADLVVADLTDLNPNAFYELGIRHSIEKPTIHVAKSGTRLPFDNVSHRTIFVDLTDWHSTERSRSQLAASARAIKELGFQVTNPITQANASFKMRESADPRERIIADLQERVSSLELRSPELQLERSHNSWPPSGSELRRLQQLIQSERREKTPLSRLIDRIAAEAHGRELNIVIEPLEDGRVSFHVKSLGFHTILPKDYPK